MPAKGRYFLNEGEEGPDHDVLYEKYRLTSQHGPLLLTLLLVAVAACTALVVLAFGSGVSEGSTGFSGVRVSALTPGTCEVFVGRVGIFPEPEFPCLKSATLVEDRFLISV